MRRLIVVLLVVSAAPLAAPSVPVGAERTTAVPFVPRACTPEGPMDQVRPAGCRRVLYTYGPIHITPGDNLILLGPVTIEKPLEDGWVVRFKPNLIRADGSVPGIEVLHLHHAVWLSSAFSDPIFASGEEKTIVSIPNGYGIPSRTRDVWLLNYMLHNQTPVPDNVFITYELDFVPASAVPAGSIRDVRPYWLDVRWDNRANPVYNTQRGFGATPGECTFPKERCALRDPFGDDQPGNGAGWTRSNVPAGTIVWMGGHVHPGGLRTEVDLRRGSETRRVFRSDAVYFDPNGPVSWDLSMEVTRPDFRLRVNAGDTFVLNSTYENARASWYEGMGIVVMFVAPGDGSGPDPFAATVDPDNVAITHGHLREASRYGGPDDATVPLPPGGPGAGVVGIGGFTYTPGTFGAPWLPQVPRDEGVVFVNLDVPGAIFHTVTACRAPCNGATGISYPLANGPEDFDSLELGYGPPGLTAAANTSVYALDTSGFDPGPYTYFCRVHPFMRGGFEVV